jgi:bifunctional non-homologous end joining protein LigD
MTTESIQADGREIEISNADKVLFPQDGITKLDLARYWSKIAETALPHYGGRPLTMQRFPDGIGEGGFFQKNIPDPFPDWIDRVDLPKEGGHVTHVVANDAATLIYLANQGCITPHLGLSRCKTPGCPDRLIFDLDPSDDDFGKVQEVARTLREALDARDLPSFVATTGSRGLHIVLSLDGSAPVDALRPFARSIAKEVAAARPELATTEQRKSKRGDRVLVDTFRTAFGQTAVGAYAPRARPKAPVATPIRWKEAFASDLAPDKYAVSSVFRRLGQIEDPWLGMGDNPIVATTLTDQD